MPTATHLVLTTPELLEFILSDLPPHHLLPLLRVSRFFHHTISTSPRLQRLLYLRPDPTIPPQHFTINPLLRAPFLPFFVTPEPTTSMPDHNALQRLDWMRSDSTRDAFLRADASWRRMLLIQPPPMELQSTSATSWMGDYGIEDGPPVSCAPDGVTMGLVYDIVESFVRRGETIQRFGLAITAAAEGTAIRVHLENLIQCCSVRPRERNMFSKGRRVDMRLIG